VAHAASIDAVAHEGRPGRHVPAAGNPAAATDDESYHGSTSELPPATSHGYAEWDFSGVPDPVMFRRFLDAADYCFGYSDNSSAGSYNPTRECFVVLANDQVNNANTAEAGDGEVPPSPGAGPHQGAGPSAPPPSPPRGADINALLAQARELEAKLVEEYRAVRLLRASIAGEASARSGHARELGQQARERINTDFDVDNASMPPRASQKFIATATLLWAMPLPQHPRHGTCTARRRRSSSKRSCSRSRARRPASASRGACGTMGAHKALRRRCTRAARQGSPLTKGARRSRSGSLTRAGRPKTVTLAMSSTLGG
jgi:hypothetical protein